MSPKAVSLLIVLCATLLAHAAAKDGEFIFFDDGRFVQHNPHIETVGNPLRFFTDPETVASPDQPTKDIYRPIRTLSYALIATGWGQRDAKAYHAVSIVLHALCAVLLAAVLMAAGLGAWPAAAGALFWSLHPVTVEVSAWVCSLGDIWCGLFSLAAILAHARNRFVIANLALVLALFSKEHAVVVPGIWLAWDVFLRRDAPGAVVQGLKRAVAPGLVLVIAFLVVRGQLGLGMSQRDEALGGSNLEAMLTMLSGMGWYIATILLPSGPTFQARVEPHVVGVIVGIVVVAGLLRAVVKASPRVRLGAAWFLIALVPVSNIVVPLKIPTADRFLYLPLMGFGVLVAELCRRRPRVTAWSVPLALIVLALVTQRRIGDWKDSESLYQAGIRVEPKSPMLMWFEASHNASRALDLLDAEEFDAAAPHAERAVNAYNVYLKSAGTRDVSKAWFELGVLLERMGYWSERNDNQRYKLHYTDALRAFVNAYREELGGRGRLGDVRLRVAAEVAVKLCVRMAEPGNPNLTKVVAIGEELLKFLDARYGASVGMDFARLRFAYSVFIRGDQPAKARIGYNQVLRVLESEEKRGRYVKFLRGQTFLYRAILKDQPADRGGMERAAGQFEEIERERLEEAINARFQRAKVYCAMAKVLMAETPEFRKAMARKGRDLLDSLPEFAKQVGRRISRAMKMEIGAEHRGCLPR